MSISAISFMPPPTQYDQRIAKDREHCRSLGTFPFTSREPPKKSLFHAEWATLAGPVRQTVLFSPDSRPSVGRSLVA